jgi:hypothetical protein
MLIIPTLLSILSMPTSARKSSLGASRRAQQRAHLPFRADDLGHGKKTGLPVPTVEHKSDDFEPFDEILSHADTRAAWHGQNKRPGSTKKRKSVVPLYEDDDGGDMSMELEDYGKLCPVFVQFSVLEQYKVDLSLRTRMDTFPTRDTPHHLWLVVLAHLRVSLPVPRMSISTRCHLLAHESHLLLACAVHRLASLFGPHILLRAVAMI